MAGLQAPLSTLRLAPRDVLRMTRGQSGLLFLYCCGLSPFALCAVSRRTSVSFRTQEDSGQLRRYCARRDHRGADVVGLDFLAQPFGEGPHGVLGSRVDRTRRVTLWTATDESTRC